jgi:hypothetical protein
MQRELLRQIINVHDRQTRPYFTQVDEGAPLENVARCSFDPSGLIERSSKEPTSIEKVRVHLIPVSATRGHPAAVKRPAGSKHVLVGNRLCAPSGKPIR